jgi:hypothetical protein
LLKIQNPEITGKILIATAGGANARAPKLYAYLLIHAIGLAIDDLFGTLDARGMTNAAAPNAAGTPEEQTLSSAHRLLNLPAVTNAGAPAPATANYGEIKRLFGAGTTAPAGATPA